MGLTGLQAESYRQGQGVIQVLRRRDTFPVKAHFLPAPFKHTFFILKIAAHFVGHWEGIMF